MGGYTLTSDPVTSYPNSRARSATPPMKVPQIPSMCTRLDIKRSKMQRQAYHVLCDLKSAAQGDIDVCRSSPKRLLCSIWWRYGCHQCQCTGGHPNSSGLSRQDWKNLRRAERYSRCTSRRVNRCLTRISRGHSRSHDDAVGRLWLLPLQAQRHR